MRLNVTVYEFLPNFPTAKYVIWMLIIDTGLILTAKTEVQIASFAFQRPPTTGSIAAHGLSEALLLLLAATETEKSEEDVFQAKVCTAWGYSNLRDHDAALATLPPDLSKVPDSLSRRGGITSQWTHVGVVKGAYIRGNVHER